MSEINFNMLKRFHDLKNQSHQSIFLAHILNKIFRSLTHAAILYTIMDSFNFPNVLVKDILNKKNVHQLFARTIFRVSHSGTQTNTIKFKFKKQFYI